MKQFHREIKEKREETARNEMSTILNDNTVGYNEMTEVIEKI
jgi:hypothetical protein